MGTAAPDRTAPAYDVIVVGARPAGAATAMLLARAGLSVLVLDRDRPGADTVSTHALLRTGVLQLARWGVLGGITGAGAPPIGRSTFTYADQRLTVDVKPAYGVDALYAPRRTLLDPLLVGAARQAGATVRHDVTVRGVLWRNGRVAGVDALDRNGGVEARAGLVVGADGMASTVARAVGAGTTRAGRHASAVTYGYWRDLDTDGYEWVFRRGACSGVIPTGDGEACVFASAPRDRIGRGGVEVIGDVARVGSGELAHRLSRAGAPSRTRTWPGRRGYLRRPHGPGWALVGDAGYFKDPLSAHGISDALRDAELLARAIIEGLARGALDVALAGYAATRDRLSIGLFDTVDEIAGHAWTDEEILPLLLRLSDAMNDEVDLLASLPPLPPVPGIATPATGLRGHGSP
jgi:flavin-dependent dehydrogenase